MPYENMAAAITRPTASQQYALLFVGVCNVERYPRSLIRWTNLLHEMYGYPLENIRIIVGPYADPTWPQMVAGTDVTYNAQLADLDNALAAYAYNSGHPLSLGPDDKLFIFTFNHGGQDGGGCYLCCDNFQTKYYASTFANRIADIRCSQIVLLAAQCHAGGFVDPFINALYANVQGAVLAGCRSDQYTYEAVFDKVVGSVLNGRMVEYNLDDNIGLGITGDGVGVYLVPGYHERRFDWGPEGVIGMREAHNLVTDHYVSSIYPSYPAIVEIPLYKQRPWLDAQGRPVYIRLGEPDLVMQDCAQDTGVEPSTCQVTWLSPDVRPDNSDAFPGLGQYEYVPAHYNRFFVRTANRGTAPTEEVWRYLDVRGLGYVGGQVGPPRIDRAREIVGGVTDGARLRPGRAHTQFDRILIGGDFGHGCVVALTWCPRDEQSHPLVSIRQDNDQVQCNMNAAAVSGQKPVDPDATNSNSLVLKRVIPVVAFAKGEYRLTKLTPVGELKPRMTITPERLVLNEGEPGEFQIAIEVDVAPDGLTAELPVAVMFNEDVIGGVTFMVRTATTEVVALVRDTQGLPVPGRDVLVSTPGDERVLKAVTDAEGSCRFTPLNPGSYFVMTEGMLGEPVRVVAIAGQPTEPVVLTVQAGMPLEKPLSKR